MNSTPDAKLAYLFSRARTTYWRISSRPRSAMANLKQYMVRYCAPTCLACSLTGSPRGEICITMCVADLFIGYGWWKTSVLSPKFKLQSLGSLRTLVMLRYGRFHSPHPPKKISAWAVRFLCVAPPVMHTILPSLFRASALVSPEVLWSFFVSIRTNVKKSANF